MKHTVRLPGVRNRLLRAGRDRYARATVVTAPRRRTPRVPRDTHVGGLLASVGRSIKGPYVYVYLHVLHGGSIAVLPPVLLLLLVRRPQGEVVTEQLHE